MKGFPFYAMEYTGVSVVLSNMRLAGFALNRVFAGRARRADKNRDGRQHLRWLITLLLRPSCCLGFYTAETANNALIIRHESGPD